MITLLILLFAAEFITLCCLVYNYLPGWSILTLIVTFVLYDAFWEKLAYKHLGEFIVNNPMLIVSFIILYLIIGLLWSFYKWYLYLKDSKKQNRERDYTNSPSYNKDKIIAWMAYWPISMLLFVVGDLFSTFYNWLYSRVSGIYERIYLSVFPEADADKKA